MNKKIKVLVFPCGSENASEIYDALKYSVHVELWGGSSVEDFGRLNFENYIDNIPFINSDDFNDHFINIIKSKSIDVVFATHDSVINHLSKIKDGLFYLVNGNQETTELARSKIKTYKRFSQFDWCPKVYNDNINEINWPVIIKPDFGQGAQGVYKVDDINSLNSIIESVDNPVIVEFLPGEEITIDCFTNWKGELKFFSPRTRERIRAGISMRSSYLDRESSIEEIATNINDCVKFRGPWFFQLKKDKFNKWKLLEISCRIAGTMVAQRARGVNLPLLAVQDYMERDVVCLENKNIKTVERRIKTKAILDFSYRKVYVDLDDTLIVNNQVCIPVISFIYQSINNNKKIILITRHDFDIKKTLRNFNISLDLFDEIIHIKNKTLKSIHIDQDSIFIDNFFLERLDVYNSLNIPCFDVDAIDFLLK